MERFKKILLIALSAVVFASVGNVSAMEKREIEYRRKTYDVNEYFSYSDGSWYFKKPLHGKVGRLTPSRIICPRKKIKVSESVILDQLRDFEDQARRCKKSVGQQKQVRPYSSSKKSVRMKRKRIDRKRTDDKDNKFVLKDGVWLHAKGPHRNNAVSLVTCRKHGLDCGEKIRKTEERSLQPEVPVQPDLGQTEQPLLQGWANKITYYCVDVNRLANSDSYGMDLLRMFNGMSTSDLEMVEVGNIKMVEVDDDGEYVIEKDPSGVETDDEVYVEYEELDPELEYNPKELADIKEQFKKITPEILKQIRREIHPTIKNKVFNCLNRIIENKARSLSRGIVSGFSIGYFAVLLVQIISNMSSSVTIPPFVMYGLPVMAAILAIFGSWNAYKAYVAYKSTAVACKLATNNNQPATNNNQPATNQYTHKTSATE